MPPRYYGGQSKKGKVNNYKKENEIAPYMWNKKTICLLISLIKNKLNSNYIRVFPCVLQCSLRKLYLTCRWLL